MRYEQIVQFLNDLPKKDFFGNPAVVQDYNARLGRFAIGKELLGRLWDEQHRIGESSEKCVNLMGKEKDVFKHYISVEGKWVAVYFQS